MRMLKSSALVCAGILCVTVSVRAEDNANQAAARAALLQKMQEMDQGDNNNTATFSPAPTDVPSAPAASTTFTKPAKKKTVRPATVIRTPDAAPSYAPAPVEVPMAQPDASAVPPLTKNSAPSQAYAPNQDNDAQSAARAALV